MARLLHEAVRQEIVRRIKAKTYRAGEALPSAAELAREFDVSAITIKRALRDLRTCGVLRTVPGRGTFVRDQRRFIRDLGFSLSSLDDARRLGLMTSIRLISITRERVADPGFELFDVPNEFMLCVRKVILLEDNALMHDTSYLPSSISDDILEVFARRFLVDALNELGMEFKGTRLVIDAAPASLEIQAAFDLPTGYPTLRRLYALDTADPDFSIFGIAEAPFDRLACTVELGSPRQSAPERRRHRGARR